jgi:hypothetical protein
MAKYRKKPVEIEAFKYDGDLMTNGDWCVPDWAVQAYKTGKLFYGYEGLIEEEPPVDLFVKTAKGRKLIKVGDYVILRRNGEISPCNPDIFELTYDIPDRENEIDKAVKLLNSNEYYVIKNSKSIEDAINRCNELEEQGEYVDCDGCPANICLLNMNC